MPSSRSIQAYLLLPALLLGACSPPPRVAVLERETIDRRLETEKLGGSIIRIVQSGDTLHAIAFANSLNVNQLAAWNQLSDTSKLRIGQRIRLTKPLGFVEQRNPPKPVKPKIVVVESTDQDRTSRADSRTVPVAAERNKPATTPKPKPVQASSVRWGWPAQGAVIGQFASSQTQQGIDIRAELGAPVIAAGGGEVVYVGNGLKGYGNLIIIKHNERFLSAYAHNQQTFVGEGMQVTAGQKVGSIGLDKLRRSALHFQIRKEGIPVNPLRYLPKR